MQGGGDGPQSFDEEEGTSGTGSDSAAGSGATGRSRKQSSHGAVCSDYHSVEQM